MGTGIFSNYEYRKGDYSILSIFIPINSLSFIEKAKKVGLEFGFYETINSIGKHPMYFICRCVCVCGSIQSKHKSKIIHPTIKYQRAI
jgi:hypothetical protein